MLLTSVRRAVAVVVLATLLLVLPAGAGAGAGAAAPKRAKCATGALPVTKVVRGTVAYVRD
ncbi:MAG: hypothetical protein JWO90_254, partial [Solirubrobacterales bacterium]|nr:hypothetical protein [Solirubrobacterales bacterium]